MTRDQLEALPIGSTVHRGKVRADLRVIHKDANTVRVMAFPQDVNWSQGLMWQTWSMGEVFPGH